MKTPKLIREYHNLPGPKEHYTGSEEAPDRQMNLKQFIETYAVSLPAIVRAFPRGNLDINAIEAHTWDRLKAYFKYQLFQEVRIEDQAEMEFIDEAIRLIEAWFYKGEWAECVATPSAAEIEQAVKKHKVGFVEKVRQRQEPNLARDLGPGRKRPLPDFLKELGNSQDPQAVYRNHAFKFFQGPAGIMNVFTKINTEHRVPVDISKLENLIDAAFAYGFKKMKNEWGEVIPRPSQMGETTGTARAFLTSASWTKNLPHFRHPKAEYRRVMYFMKNAMIAGEIIRRGNGVLTKDLFEQTTNWVAEAQATEDKKQQALGMAPSDFFPFDFAQNENFGRSSIMHANSKIVPFSLFVADYMREKHETK